MTMDIAASFPVKTPQRAAEPRAAVQDDPYNDDFASELAKTAPRDEPEQPATKTQSVKEDEPAAPAAEAQPSTGDATAKSDLNLLTHVIPPPVAPSPATAGETKQPQAGAVLQSTPAQQAQNGGAILGQTPPAAVPNAGQPAADSKQGAGVVAQTPAQSQDAATAELAAAAQKETPQPVKDLTALAVAAAPIALDGTKSQPAQRTQNAKAAAPEKTEPATTARAPDLAGAPPTEQTPQPQPSAGKQDQSGDKAAAANPLAAGAAQPQQQPKPQEFKIDAGAATIAPQPASSPAQNAPTAAPALVAQNAPVFVPPEALGVYIARKAVEGVNRFEIRLDPPELGRVDVTLEVDDSGATRAHFRAERPEALELLQREAKGMEQALRQAGVQFDASGLSFSLFGRDGREAQQSGHHGRKAKFTAVLPEDEIHAGVLRGGAPAVNGLDLRV
jgi:flagellar hook-length control protein FliK